MSEDLTRNDVRSVVVSRSWIESGVAVFPGALGTPSS